MNIELKELVYTAMQNAVDNGHVFMQSSYLAVAVDLCDNDSDLEEYEPEELVRYVKQFCWQPEVDKIKAFITEGNYGAADERINMFVPDIKEHIESYLSPNVLMCLDIYRNTRRYNGK